MLSFRLSVCYIVAALRANSFGRLCGAVLAELRPGSLQAMRSRCYCFVVAACGRTLKCRFLHAYIHMPVHSCARYTCVDTVGGARFSTLFLRKGVYDLIERFMLLFGVFLFLFLFLWYGRVVSKSWRGSFGGAVRALFLYARSVWVLALRVSAWLAGRVWGCRD